MSSPLCQRCGWYHTLTCPSASIFFPLQKFFQESGPKCQRGLWYGATTGPSAALEPSVAVLRDNEMAEYPHCLSLPRALEGLCGTTWWTQDLPVPNPGSLSLDTWNSHNYAFLIENPLSVFGIQPQKWSDLSRLSSLWSGEPEWQGGAGRPWPEGPCPEAPCAPHGGCRPRRYSQSLRAPGPSECGPLGSVLAGLSCEHGPPGTPSGWEQGGTKRGPGHSTTPGLLGWGPPGLSVCALVIFLF